MPPHTYVSRSTYAAQLKAFQQSDLQRQSLCDNLIHDYEKLFHDYQVAVNDATAANESRRTYQDKCASLETVVEEYKHKIESNSFVVVVIDGDGAIFHQDLLTAGQDRGSDAASRLHIAVKRYVQERYEHLRDYSVIVSIFANLEGLGRKLASVGFVQSPHGLRAFARSFTLHQPLFNIIDVGEGKERADYKVKGTSYPYPFRRLGSF
ncbi:hypothetical protein EJ08DRAFT_703525 [Tothia fuscella]|uniref:DUF7923 domain-containing protein n=1 Tax=Tothia fuscella TaxID=1048955 RepID=A0A9P4NEA0_9PEZI|nr:hypothetical protein EJ08DRAFT_703525 [Tothia fuscella]